MKKSEDNRRTLIEWIEDAEIRSCKVLIAREETVVGGHYHKNKDEYFYLLSGHGLYKLNGEGYRPFHGVLTVPRGTFHEFRLAKDAVLLGAASEPFDPTDEYK